MIPLLLLYDDAWTRWPFPFPMGIPDGMIPGTAWIRSMQPISPSHAGMVRRIIRQRIAMRQHRSAMATAIGDAFRISLISSQVG